MDPFTKEFLIKVTMPFIVLGGFVLSGFILYAATILIWSAPNFIFKHDAIIVLTGSKGRIEKGFSLLLNNKAPRMLISGVEENSAMADIIEQNSQNLNRNQIERIRNHCCIALDRIANTTETNAIESAKWIRDNQIKSILMVTSSQHMPRAYLLFSNAIDDDVFITVYPYQAQSRLTFITSQSFWRSVVEEYMKFIGTLLLILNPARTS